VILDIQISLVVGAQGRLLWERAHDEIGLIATSVVRCTHIARFSSCSGRVVLFGDKRIWLSLGFRVWVIVTPARMLHCAQMVGRLNRGGELNLEA
jgi:hypothetical protein